MATKINVRPLGEKVLVQRTAAETTTAGGIVLPDSATEKPQEGKILAVGDGRLLDDGTRKPLQVKANDVVIFSSYAGTDIKIDGEEYLLMNESDILAIVD